MHYQDLQSLYEIFRYTYHIPPFGQLVGQFLSSALTITIYALLFIVVPAIGMLGTGDPKKPKPKKPIPKLVRRLFKGKFVWGLIFGSSTLLLGMVAIFPMAFSGANKLKSTPPQESTRSKAVPPPNAGVPAPSLPGVQAQQGDLKHHGGTPTIRKTFTPQVDNPSTTNDESNDQPIGHLGTVTINVYNVSSGNSYPLDADIEDGQVKRLYFEKGGWVDFDDAEIDSDGNGEGTDETGHEWRFEGFAN